MAGFSSFRALRPSPGSWLSRRLPSAPRHPDAFDCGLRVVAGTLPGASHRWRFRLSAVDPLHEGGTVVLNHGTALTLRLRVDREPAGAGPRPGYVQLSAVDVTTAARVSISAPLGEVSRFGIIEL